MQWNILYFTSGIYAAIGLGSASDEHFNYRLNPVHRGTESVEDLIQVRNSYFYLPPTQSFFRQLLVTVVRATFRFHDTTPQGDALRDVSLRNFADNSFVAGRMLNRFGKDIETIDGSLAGSLHTVNSSLAGLFTSMVTVA
jgi:hypothetical protein